MLFGFTCYLCHELNKALIIIIMIILSLFVYSSSYCLLCCGPQAWNNSGQGKIFRKRWQHRFPTRTCCLEAGCVSLVCLCACQAHKLLEWASAIVWAMPQILLKPAACLANSLAKLFHMLNLHVGNSCSSILCACLCHSINLNSQCLMLCSDFLIN